MRQSCTERSDDPPGPRFYLCPNCGQVSSVYPDTPNPGVACQHCDYLVEEMTIE